MGKPPIVILHGWGLSGEKFKHLSDLLTEEGYRVYAPDLPGFGESDPPPFAYTLEDYAVFVSDYLKTKSIQDPVFIGHSFGGRVSIKLNSMNPGLIRKLILTGTPGYTPVPRRKLVLFIAIAKIGNWVFGLPILREMQEHVRKWYYYIVGAREFYRAEGVMRQVFKNIVQEKLDTLIPMIKIPCLLVWGEYDQITPVWIAKRMNSAIKGSKLIIIPETDHGVSYKNPAKFYDAVRSFLISV